MVKTRARGARFPCPLLAPWQRISHASSMHRQGRIARGLRRASKTSSPLFLQRPTPNRLKLHGRQFTGPYGVTWKTFAPKRPGYQPWILDTERLPHGRAARPAERPSLFFAIGRRYHERETCSANPRSGSRLTLSSFTLAITGIPFASLKISVEHV